MPIASYIKVIGRGREGARALTQEQAADLFGQVLDGTVTDLEIGAFCLAMRIKGETPEEMAGFLQATHQRLYAIPTHPTSRHAGLVVLPSYNGARRLPVLTPLLALLLAREGLAVLIHGSTSENSRICASKVLETLEIPAQAAIKFIADGEVAFVPTALLLPGLKRLLDVRRTVGLRNPAHSLVKLMNPCAGRALIVSSYTHPEYALSMAETFVRIQADAMLLRGTEGEPVADPRRLPQMEGFSQGQRFLLEAGQTGPLVNLPDLPMDTSAESTSAYIRAVLAGDVPVPPPIVRQAACIVQMVQGMAGHALHRKQPHFPELGVPP